MKATILAAIKEAFGSKKFLVMLAAIITAAASKLGLNIDPTTLNWVLGLAASYIVGQGIADIGKPAAQVAAKANAATLAAISPSRAPQAGFVARGIMPYLMALAVVIGATLASCSLFRGAASDASTCAKAEASFSVSALVGYAVDVGSAIVAAATGNDAPLAALIVKDGETLCACIANDIAAAHPATAATAKADAAPNIGDAARQVIATHHWETYGGAK